MNIIIAAASVALAAVVIGKGVVWYRKMPEGRKRALRAKKRGKR